MTLQLTKIDDPRDSLEKARRRELVVFARRHGVDEIGKNPGMPAMLMRRILREKGLTQIAIPRRVLGQPELRGRHAPVGPANPDIAERAEGITVDALTDLERQVGEHPRAIALLTFNQIRAECKRRGVKLERTDNLETLRKKLTEARRNAQDPS